MTKRNEVQKFMRSVLAVEQNDCILWPYSLTKDGYPQMRWKGKILNPHVIACEEENGPKPDWADHAAHLCGENKCVNKRHMAWATREQNENHRHLHNIEALERKGIQRLTADQVREIRARSAAGESANSISRSFPVTHGAIKKIILGETYRLT